MAENFRIQDGITFPDGSSQTAAGTTLPADAVGVLTNDGAGNLSWAPSSGGTPAETYKGFKAVYGRMYNDSRDLPDGHNITKIVIYKDTVTPTASVGTAIADDTDYFRVTGLTGSDFVALFNYYGATSTAPEVSAMKLFTKAIIDNVILVDGVEGSMNTVTDMKSDFYANYSNIAAEAGTLVPDFEFYAPFNDIATTTVIGSGIVFSITNNIDNTYTPNLSLGGTDWQVGHQIRVTGSQLGGVDGDNDAIITIDSVTNGVVDSFSASGTSTGNGTTYNGLNYSHFEDGYGARLTFNYNFDTNTVYNTNIANQGQLYVTGDIITVLGTDIGGTSPANDMVFRVTDAGAFNGGIRSYELVSGSPSGPLFPQYNIYDGGDDQYDTGNYIYTDLQGDTYIDGPSNEYGALDYENGNVSSGDPWFGSGSQYAVLYHNSIFGVVATGVAIDWIGTDGASGWDNNGNADAGDIFNPATSGGTTTAPYLSLTNDGFAVDQFVGDEVLFAKSNDGNEVDIIDTDLQITRGNNQGPYNPVTDGSYNGGVIGNTEWNADGWNNLSDVTTRTYYSTARDAFYAWGNDSGNDNWPNLVGAELIMHDTNNNKYYTFKFTNWQVSNAGGGMEYVRRQINLDAYFVRSSYGSEVDDFGNGTAIARGGNSGIYNPYDEGSWNSDYSPGGTLWNADGWADLTNITTRSYVAFYSAVTHDSTGVGSVILGREYVMHDTNNDEYYAIKFLQWQNANQGAGFQYFRRKIDKANKSVGIRFADGTRQTTAYVPSIALNKWTSPNGSPWRIVEYNGAAAVNYEGNDTGAIWWDATNSPGGWGDFRGAVVEYHAYCDQGTIVGTIIMAQDGGGASSTATHNEATSGNSGMSNYVFWDRSVSDTALAVKRVGVDSTYGDNSIYVQWTSRIFYGNDYYC